MFTEHDGKAAGQLAVQHEAVEITEHEAVRVARTSSRISPFVCLMSIGIRDGLPHSDLIRGHMPGDAFKLKRTTLWQCQAFRVLEECLRTVWPKAGEEIVLIARKPDEQQK